MTIWTEMSIEFANQRNYLDELFRIYPTIPEGVRDIIKKKENQKRKLLKRIFQKDSMNLGLK